MEKQRKCNKICSRRDHSNQP